MPDFFLRQSSHEVTVFAPAAVTVKGDDETLLAAHDLHTLFVALCGTPPVLDLLLPPCSRVMVVLGSEAVQEQL